MFPENENLYLTLLFYSLLLRILFAFRNKGSNIGNDNGNSNHGDGNGNANGNV